jgi:hypothetical protein
MTQADTDACIADETAAAAAHAVWLPDATRPAAASAARSAAACARCLAITAEPTIAPPTVSTIRTVIIAAATTLAAPRSPTGFDRGNRRGCDGEPRQWDGPGGDPRDDESAVAVQHQLGTGGSTATHRLGGGVLVTAGSQPGGLTRGIDTSHLGRDGGEAAGAQHHDHRQCGDGERRLDRDTSFFVAQTLVFSALVMMLVNALTIESPVTTV